MSLITEQNGQAKWQKMLKEELNVADEKLGWVSEYAANHEIKESAIGVNAGATMVPGTNVGPLYATPLNTIGMGNVAAPGVNAQGQVPTQAGDFFTQRVGSGDIPMSTLPMALNIALMTIGLELVPVIPTKGPWLMLSYMDFPYGGGKLGRINETSFDGVGDGKENKPYYVKVKGDISDADLEAIKALEENTEITLTGDNGVLVGKYKGFGRMDGQLLLEVVSVKASADDDAENVSLHTAVDGTLAGVAGSVSFSVENATPDFVETMVDFMDGFANFATGEKQPMSRAENETGTGNTIGLRLFSKWVSVGSYEVTGTVTRQQLQDLPLYGVDAVGKIMEAMLNEISQHINARILEHVFALGVTNAVKIKRTYNADLNTWIGTQASATGKPMSKATYKDIYGVGHEWEVATTEVNTSAENLHTRQRRIASRIMAAANLIQVIGRRGRATWAVMSAKMATALQDVSGYVVAPSANNLVQDGSKSLYKAGSIMGLQIYVDPYMGWNDNRICIGRKGDANSPGVIFAPYILADTVSITAEGTMAPKMLINSRFGIIDCGFFPESMYYTFCVGGNIEII